MPTIERASKSRTKLLEKDAYDDIKRKKLEAMKRGSNFIDPSAEQGFTRGAELADSVKQNKPEKLEEMPQDLINFLSENPLERRVDKDMTSKKVYDQIKEEEGRRMQQDQEAKLRKRRKMPIVENMDMDGLDRKDLDDMTYMTSRTTNFSTKRSEDENKAGLHLKDVELFQLLKRIQTEEFSAEKYVSDNASTYRIKEDEIEASVALIQNIQKYVGVPTVMQDDTDKSLVGAWPNRVADLELMKLKPIKVEFLLEKEQ